MLETQQTITDWTLATFGEANTLDPAERERRFREEVAELLLQLSTPVGPETRAAVAVEMADVFITLCTLASVHTIDLRSAVRSKMEQNRADEFVKALDGRVVRKGKEHHKAFDEAMPTVMVVLGKVSRQV